MTLLQPQPVAYKVGPEHNLPFPPTAYANFSGNFVPSLPEPRKAFDVFQEKLKELALDEFPYRMPSSKGGVVKPVMKENRKSLDNDSKSRTDATDEKQLLMEWKNSPWYKECKWSDDYDQLQYKLLKAKKPLRLQTIFQQFESLNLCNEEITDIGTQLIILKSLKTLSLADNRLRSVNMEILPVGLKHLELYGNTIATLVGFCPMYLRHLGLAANGIVNPLSVFAPSDLRSLVSIDLGENLISNIGDCVACLEQFPQLDNLRAAGNPISLIRSYRTQLVNAVKPRLLCIDGDEVTEQDRLNYRAITYDSFACSLTAPNQCIVLLTIDEIVGAPRPSGYKWAYTVEIAFPGCLLPTKPALPPPTAEALKAEEKAKKAKAAKAGKKGHLATPVPVDPEPEPEDPFYDGLGGQVKKVLNDGFDWTWADPLVVGTCVPLLIAGEKPSALVYEYLRRGMKVRLFLKRVLYSPVVTGKKASAKPKLPKGQKSDLWAVPLSAEVADSVEIAHFTIPVMPLLHGEAEATFQIVIDKPPELVTPATPGLKKNKPHPPAAGNKEAKSCLAAHTKTVEDHPAEKVPMTVRMRVKIHHDQTPADLQTYPPEIAPYVPETKPLDAHSHNSTTPKSLSPRT